MAKRTLTPERRAELAALLDDEQRLRAEYPKVKEYLDMAPTLPGTGDVRADAAFDPRFVHYVTGGRAESANPYWDIVAPSVFEHEGRRVVNGRRPDGSARLAYAQMLLQPEPADVWHQVGDLGELAGNVASRSDRVLFLCWPPGWGSTMASEALAAFEKSGGSRLMFVGQPRGGMTGMTPSSTPCRPDGSWHPRTRGFCRGGTWRTWLRPGCDDRPEHRSPAG